MHFDSTLCVCITEIELCVIIDDLQNHSPFSCQLMESGCGIMHKPVTLVVPNTATLCGPSVVTSSRLWTEEIAVTTKLYSVPGSNSVTLAVSNSVTLSVRVSFSIWTIDSFTVCTVDTLGSSEAVAKMRYIVAGGLPRNSGLSQESIAHVTPMLSTDTFLGSDGATEMKVTVKMQYSDRNLPWLHIYVNVTTWI